MRTIQKSETGTCLNSKDVYNMKSIYPA